MTILFALIDIYYTFYYIIWVIEMRILKFKETWSWTSDSRCVLYQLIGRGVGRRAGLLRYIMALTSCDNHLQAVQGNQEGSYSLIYLSVGDKGC